MALDFNKGMVRFSGRIKDQANTHTDLDQSIAGILDLQKDFNQAREDRLFVPLPSELEEKSKDWSRIKTIRNRLFCMGYLEKDSGTGHLDNTLRNGIRAFQKEAGLKVDGWVGEKETWPALQELVSFETQIDLNKWMNSGNPSPALRRAIALRLFVLGLRETRPASADDDILTGMKTFGQSWNQLEFDGTALPAGMNLEWIKRLFDMDGISRNLSKVNPNLSKQRLKLSHSLILNAAKIELWLMGYHVKPNGYDLKTVAKPVADSGLTGWDIMRRSKTLSHRLKVKKSIKLYRQLHKFWMEHGKYDDEADELSVNFLTHFQAFFAIVDKGISSKDTLDSVEDQDKIEAFISDKKEQLPSIWTNVKQFGARIWDGVRRAWGWFKRLVTGVIDKVHEIGLNISRIVYNFALGSFTVVSNILKSIGTTIKVISDPRMPGSDPDHVMFIRDRDFDPTVFINQSSHGENIRKCTRILNYEMRKFSFGCRIIGAIVSILAQLLTKTWTGYFGLVFGLVKLNRMKSSFKSLMDEYLDIFVFNPLQN